MVPKKWDCLSEKEKCWQNMSKKNDKVMNLLYQARFDTRHLVSGSRAFFSLGKCENPWNFCINPWRSSVWSGFQSIFLKEKCSIKPSKSKTEVVKVYVISKQKKRRHTANNFNKNKAGVCLGQKFSQNKRTMKSCRVVTRFTSWQVRTHQQKSNPCFVPGRH